MNTKIALFTLGTATALLSGCVETYSPAPGGAVVTTYQPGYVVQTLPQGYRTEVISGTRYYYHDNVYYRPQGSSYVVVRSPRPGGTGWDGNQRGYDRDWDGVDRDGDGRDRDDYQHHRHSEVRVIHTLPSGYVVVNRSGQRYYRVGNVYYQSRSGGYVVVDSPF